MKYCISSEKHKSQLIDLWISVFGNEKEAKLFFEEMYSSENTFIALDNDRVIAMLYLLPCYMVNVGSCGYIYAAATREGYRNKGIMKNLILYTYNESKERGLKAITLLPANNELYDTYSKYGFAVSHYIREVYPKAIPNSTFSSKKTIQ